jgi:hypothetical protein
VAPSWADCRHALAERVRGLGLDGLAPAQVYEHLANVAANTSFPCVELSLAGLTESWKWWTTDHLLWSYPVGLLVLFRGDPKDPPSAGPYLGWRDQIAIALPGWKPAPDGPTPLPGLHRVRAELAGNISAGFRGRSEPGQVRDPQGPAWLKVAGALVVTFDVVKPRAQ